MATAPKHQVATSATAHATAPPKGGTTTAVTPTPYTEPAPSAQGGGGFDWNPISWVTSAVDWTKAELQSAAHFVGANVVRLAGWTRAEVAAVGADVVQFVSKGLHGLWLAVLHVANGVHHVVVGLNHTLHDVGQWAHTALAFVEHAPSWLASHVQSALATFYHQVVVPAVDGAEAAAAQLAHNVEGNLEHAVGNLEGWVSDAVHPLEHWVADASEWFGTEFEDAWHTVYADVVHPALAELEQGVAHVAPLVTYGIGDIIAAAELVAKSADWLVWLSEHALGDLVALVEGDTSVFRPPSQRAMVAETQDNAHVVLSYLHDLLGA